MRRIEQAGGIVLNRSGQALLVKASSKKWGFPKGKIEEDESAEDAARREVREETGIAELALLKELGSYERLGFTKENLETPSVIKHITCFVFRTGQWELRVDDAGTLDAAWTDLGDVHAKLSHEQDKEFFARHQATVRKLLT